MEQSQLSYSNFIEAKICFNPKHLKMKRGIILIAYHELSSNYHCLTVQCHTELAAMHRSDLLINRKANTEK